MRTDRPASQAVPEMQKWGGGGAAKPKARKSKRAAVTSDNGGSIESALAALRADLETTQARAAQLEEAIGALETLTST